MYDVDQHKFDHIPSKYNKLLNKSCVAGCSCIRVISHNCAGSFTVHLRTAPHWSSVLASPSRGAPPLVLPFGRIANVTRCPTSPQTSSILYIDCERHLIMCEHPVRIGLRSICGANKQRQMNRHELPRIMIAKVHAIPISNKNYISCAQLRRIIGNVVMLNSYQETGQRERLIFNGKR